MYYAHMAIRFNNPRRLGIQLRAARRSAGLSLLQLGFKTGVHHSQISRIERGLALTHSGNVQKICDSLGVDLMPRQRSEELAVRIALLEAAVPESVEAIDTLLTKLEGIALLAPVIQKRLD